MGERKLIVASAQMGPVPKSESRAETVKRLVDLMSNAASRGARLVVYGEAVLGPFFPHWLASSDSLDSYFERKMPNDSIAPLFEKAAELGVGFVLGYAELTPEGRRFNTAILVDRTGEIILKYRKIHLPGYREPRPNDPFQNLEKRYFEVGNLGFPVVNGFGGRLGLCICNDRRWPETYRVMGLQGVELIMLGYNTPLSYPAMAEVDDLTSFHNLLPMQANALANGTWVVATARGGTEEGVAQLAQSAIVAPSGQIVAMANTQGDEIITAEVDFDACNMYKQYMYNLRAHRRPEHYGLITAPASETWSVGDIE